MKKLVLTYHAGNSEIDFGFVGSCNLITEGLSMIEGFLSGRGYIECTPTIESMDITEEGDILLYILNLDFWFRLTMLEGCLEIKENSDFISRLENFIKAHNKDEE